jgi:hypothetical protein
MVDSSKMGCRQTGRLMGLLLGLVVALSSGAASACSQIEAQKMQRAGFGNARIHQICAGNSAEHLACNSREMQALARAGFSNDRTRELCASRLAQLSAAAPRSIAAGSNLCRTAEKSCTLAQRGSVGMACWCNSSYGPQPGALAAQ